MVDAIILGVALRFYGAKLWWRDDDAVRDTPALRRLLDLSAETKIPLLLAVIPQCMEASLIALVRQYPLVRVAQHGVSHHNHAPQGQKKQELVAGFDSALLTQEKRRLEDAFGEQCRSILVPPWNRIDPALVEQLPGLGFNAWSSYAHRETDHPLPRRDCAADPIRWGINDSRPFRGRYRTTAALLRALYQGWKHIGILTHHQDMDEQAWAYTRCLLHNLKQYYLDSDHVFNIVER
ncbi:MAG: polysaccharide deacetylase [Holosporales bacterium]